MQNYEIHENDIANWMQGRLSRSSGRTATDKGDQPQRAKDGKNHQFLWDCKYTDKKYYTLTAGAWKKVLDEANKEYREPLMFLRLQKDDYVVEMKSFRPKISTKKSQRIYGECLIVLAGNKIEYELEVKKIEDFL